MGARGTDELVVAAKHEPDAVLDRQPGRLARVLHRVDDLAGQTLAA